MTRDYAAYGIDPTDSKYDTTFRSGKMPPYCWCGGHSESEPRANCDLQARRAMEMNDPVWCPWCREVYERCVTDAGPVSQQGTCPGCVPEHVRPSGRRRRGGLSPARARKVFLSDPHRPLGDYSPGELVREAFDEVVS